MPEFVAEINGIEVHSFDEGLKVLRDIRNAAKQEGRAAFLAEMRERKEADKALRERAPGMPVEGEGAAEGPSAEASGDATIA